MITSGAALLLVAYLPTTHNTPILRDEFVTSDDRFIIESSVLHLLSDERVGRGWKHKLNALLDFNTSANVSWIRSNDIDGVRIPDEIERDLMRRNQTSCHLRFRPRDNRIRLCDLEVELFSQPVPRMPIDKMVERFPDCKHWVQASLPGHSSKGTQAIVQLTFGPDMHGASARYWYQRTEGKWRLKAQQTFHLN